MNRKKKNIFVFGLDRIQEVPGNEDNLWRINNYFPKYANRVEKPEKSDLILVIGGDGAMLQAIRGLRKYNKPFCGLNFGHLGFLMNEPDQATLTLNHICDDLTETIAVRLLKGVQTLSNGTTKISYAFNDFVIERTKPQTAKIGVTVDGNTYFSPLTCDGLIVSSSAGSTSYNAAAGGVVVPIGIDSLVLTGICPAVFENWRSSLLSQNSLIELCPAETEKRPVRFLADGRKLLNGRTLVVSLSDQIVRLVFLRNQNFKSKVLNLQFHRRK